MSNNYDKLLYGKDQTEGIVCIEPKDGYLDLFIQDKDGNISIKQVSNKYWLLSNIKQKGDGWVRLKGNQYYCWGKQLTDRIEYRTLKSRLKYTFKQNIYSINDGKESAMVNKGITYYKGMNFKDVSVLSFDIETTGLDFNDESKVLLISNTFRDTKGNITRKLFCYDDPGNIFENWSNWVKEMDPSIMIAHNGSSYDLPYLSFCASKTGSRISIGRDGSDLAFDTYESKFRKDATQQLLYRKPIIYGREFIDTLFLSIKYDIGRKYENYGLKTIIKHEGLEVKDRIFYDASQIRYKYNIPEEWIKIKVYAEMDADDSLALYDKMAPPFFFMNKMIPKSFQSIIESASGSQLNSMLIRAYLQEGFSLPNKSEVTELQGAISFGIPGIYNNVFKQDVNSLYPSIIRQDKLYDKQKDPEGYYLKITEMLTLQRFKNKKLAKETGLEYYSHMEQSEKILCNSMYGLCNASGLLFNSPELGAEITRRGREILSKAIMWATNKPTEYWIKEFELKTGKDLEDENEEM